MDSGSRKENLDTLPFDVFMTLFKIMAGSRTPSSDDQLTSFIPMSIILPVSRICRSIRAMIVGHPLFWCCISSDVPKGVRVACLSRSQGLNLHISGRCKPMRGNFTDGEKYWRVSNLLETTLPHAHRWETADISLCSEGQMQRSEYCRLKALLHQRTSFPRLRQLSIRYGLLENDREFYRFPDVGGNGRFYLNWEAPKLTELIATNYAPYPFIARTITSLTVQLSDKVNNAYLDESLPRAKSLRELHFVFLSGANWEWPSTSFNEGTLPQIEVLSVTFRSMSMYFEGAREADYVGEIFRFPNLSSLSFVVDERVTPENGNNSFHNTLSCFGKAVLRPLDVLELKRVYASKSSSPWTLSLRLPPTRRLKIVGRHWEALPLKSEVEGETEEKAVSEREREEREMEEITSRCEVLEELTLEGCDDGILPLVQDLMGLVVKPNYGPRGKPDKRRTLWLVQATRCTSKLVDELMNIVPFPILNVDGTCDEPSVM